jgi:glycosyltransferase involved in cell wall biosynthesis
MICVYPDAELFSSIDILPPSKRDFLAGKTPTTSFAQNWPFMRRHYRTFLPLLMFAIEQLDVSSYELVLSSSASIGKGILTGPDQLHIAYVHSPMRYAWDMHHQYLRDAGIERGFKGFMARWMLHKARMWDLRTANGVDHFIANSSFIARRIRKVYRRDATVIYPPVDTERFRYHEQKEQFFLTVSRLVPYKKMPQIVEAFRYLPDKTLVVIGDGSEMASVKRAAGKNVEILGYQPSSVVCDYMQRAKAFIFAAEEDFGISPVEAQACGTPVIAYGRGGALETICGQDREKRTGLFFYEQTPAAIAEAVREFDLNPALYAPVDCQTNASRFSISVFREKYAAFVESCWRKFKNGD